MSNNCNSKMHKNTLRKRMNMKQDTSPLAEGIENCNKLAVAFDSTNIKDYLFNALIVAFNNYCKRSRFGIRNNETGNCGDCINYDEQKIITNFWYKSDKKLNFCLAKRMFKLSLICLWHKAPDVSLVQLIRHFLCIGNKDFSYGGC